MKIKLHYSAVFQKEPDGINIFFPDIPGCVSCAFSYKEAKKMAKEALDLFLDETLIEDIPGQVFPVHYFKSPNVRITIIHATFYVKNFRLYSKKVNHLEETGSHA